MKNENLSKRFRAVIAENELQYQDIAKATKISRNTLYKILHDPFYDPRFSTIERLTKHLKIDLTKCLNEK